jgi:hypothetical protein
MWPPMNNPIFFIKIWDVERLNNYRSSRLRQKQNNHRVIHVTLIKRPIKEHKHRSHVLDGFSASRGKTISSSKSYSYVHPRGEHRRRKQRLHYDQ